MKDWEIIPNIRRRWIFIWFSPIHMTLRFVKQKQQSKLGNCMKIRRILRIYLSVETIHWIKLWSLCLKLTKNMDVFIINYQ